MVFIKARGKRSLLAGSLAVAATALTVTACGGSTSAAAAGAAPGHWTKAEVSQFTAASGATSGNSQQSCIVGYFEQDMSYANAMDVVSVDPATGPSLSAAQVKAALVSKYGATAGDAIDAQFEQTVDAGSANCDGSAAASATAAAAAPAATSESSCSIDCVDPVASGESGWLAQVQGALANVQTDLSTISADASSDPDSLSLDGSELAQDAQAALNEEVDPAPVDNSDFVAAMNDYVAAGNDYSGDNSSGQQDTAQANEEIEAGNTALSSFNAANSGSSAAATPAATAAPASTPAASATAPAATATAAALWCGAVTDVTTAPDVATWETGSGGADDVYVDVLPDLKVTAASIDDPSTPAATVLAENSGLCSEVLEADEEPPPADLAQYNLALGSFLQASEVLHTGAATFAASLAKAQADLNSGVSELSAFLAAIGK